MTFRLMTLRLTTLRVCLLMIAAVGILAGTTPFATAQTVRVDTSLGSFDIELLPDIAPINVANFLSYVTSGRYDNTVINRAQDNFVVQAGIFSSNSSAPPADKSGFTNISTDAPVQGEPAASRGLSNTVGTVALALPGLITGGPNPNGGTASFFVNGGDNSFLDPDFTVFGRVADMTAVNAIFAAPDFTDAINRYSNGDTSDLTFSDVPLQPNGDLVFINSARVLSAVIPEPSTLLLTLVGLSIGMLSRKRR